LARDCPTSLLRLPHADAPEHHEERLERLHIAQAQRETQQESSEAQWWLWID